MEGYDDQEISLIMNNYVSEIIFWPENKYVMTSKWIYKIKHGAVGSIEKHKARFVARGFSHK